MVMDTSEKEKKLNALAAEDTAYRLWRMSYEACASRFAAFANDQPEEIRNFLWGYAESGRLMQQRKVNLACEHMEFK